jgi:hypothetical protein
MVEKISVQIALEGGKEVERQLADIGEAGQQAFDQLAQSAEQVGGFKNLKPEEVTKKLEEMGLKGTEAFGKIQQAVSTAVKFENLVVGVQTAETALVALGVTVATVGAGIVAAFVVSAKSTIAFAEEINKASDTAVKLGLTFAQFKQQTQDFQKLGVYGKDAAQGLEALEKQAQKAIAAADPGSNLRLFGNAAQLAQQQLGPLLERLRQMPDGFERTKLATEQFGEAAGTAIVQGMRRAEGSMSETERRAYDLDQAFKRLRATMEEGKTLTFAPAMTAGINTLVGLIEQLTGKTGQLAAQSQQTGKQGAAAFQSWIDPMTGITVQGGQLGQSIGDAGQKAAQGLKLIQNPITGAIQAVPVLNQNLQQTGEAAAQAGNQAAQGLKLIQNPITGAIQAVPVLNQNLQQTGEAAAQAGNQTAQGFKLIQDPIDGTIRAVPQLNQNLQQTGEAAAQAGQQTAEGMSKSEQATIAQAEAAQGATSALTNYNTVASNIPTGPISESTSLWDQLTAAIQKAIDKLKEYAGKLPSGGAGLPGIGVTPGVAGGGLIGGRGSGTSDSNLAWVSRGEYVVPAHAVARPGVLGLLEAMRRGGGIPGYQAGGAVGGGIAGRVGAALDPIVKALADASNAIGAAMTALIDAMVKVNSQLIDASTQALNTHSASLRSVQDSLVRIINQVIGLDKVFASISGSASGGLLGGRGTGTSDSNLAWVSRGEFIMPAWVVARPGMLGFLEMLRSGLLPHFAAGGLAGMSNVTINFPGLSPITGLRASSAVVDELHRAAALAQVRSGGRKPSRYS